MPQDNQRNNNTGRAAAGKTARNMTAKSTRQLALEAMVSIMDNGEYCDKVLHGILDKYPLEQRDRAFLMRLVEGTVERCIELDYVIDRYSKLPVAKQKPMVREILRLAVYQIVYMDQVPDSTACNEAVKLACTNHLIPLKGFVNGVLRNVVRFYEDTPYPKAKDEVRHLSVWYSMPEWIVTRFMDQYGFEKTEVILQNFLQEDRGISLRCNLSKASMEEITASLQRQGVKVESGKLFPQALHIRNYGRLNELEAFEKGWVQVQDESSLIVGAAAPVDESSVVIDVCAAPGGKSIHIADKMNGEGLIRACDLTKDKVSLIRQNLIRTGFHNVKLKKHDAMEFLPEWEKTADVVVADLPCSGLGVIGHKADIKYKTKPQDIKALAEQQRKILQTVYRYVKPGGTLLYSTCTIAPEENERQAEWILQNLPFEAVSLEDIVPTVAKCETAGDGYIQILPDLAGGDGFFLAAFRRKEQEDNGKDGY